MRYIERHLDVIYTKSFIMNEKFEVLRILLRKSNILTNVKLGIEILSVNVICSEIVNAFRFLNKSSHP